MPFNVSWNAYDPCWMLAMVEMQLALDSVSNHGTPVCVRDQSLSIGKLGYSVVVAMATAALCHRQ